MQLAAILYDGKIIKRNVSDRGEIEIWFLRESEKWAHTLMLTLPDLQLWEETKTSQNWQLERLQLLSTCLLNTTSDERLD